MCWSCFLQIAINSCLRRKTGFKLMLNYMSGEDFLGVRSFVELGGGWLSSGRAFPTPSPGTWCYSRPVSAGESAGGTSSPEMWLLSQWICPAAGILWYLKPVGHGYCEKGCVPLPPLLSMHTLVLAELLAELTSYQERSKSRCAQPQSCWSTINHAIGQVKKDL